MTRLTQTYLTQTYLCAQPHLVPGADPGRARYVHAGLEVGADRLLLSERAAIICCAVWPKGLLWRLLWPSGFTLSYGSMGGCVAGEEKRY